MNADTIRDVLRRQPFEAFEVHLTNGEVHAVRHPEQAWLAGSSLLIYYADTDRIVWCSLLHVANIVTRSSAA